MVPIDILGFMDDTSEQLAIAVLLFLIIFGIFKLIRWKSNPLKRKWFWIIWIIPTLSILGIIHIIMYICCYYPTRDFSQKDWLENKETRIEIVGDLLASELLLEKSKDEIHELLGEPEENCPYFKSQNYDIIYYLGPRPCWDSIEYRWLLIWFNEGVVKRVGTQLLMQEKPGDIK